MTNRFSYVIFDCDGVLVDSEIVANRIEAAYKTQLGFPITVEEQIRKFVGLSVKSAEVLEEFARLPKDYLETVDEMIHAAYETELTAVEGILELLQSIRVPFCVASNSDQYWIRMKLERVGLGKFFRDEAIFTRDHVKRGKPAPDLFLYAAERMGWAPNACLVIEDSVAGVTAGVAAGMTVFGLLAGKHILDGHSNRLLEAGALNVIQSPAEVIPYLVP